MPIQYQLKEVSNSKSGRGNHQNAPEKCSKNKKNLHIRHQSNHDNKKNQCAQNNHYNIGNIKTQKINGIKKVKIPELNFDDIQNSFQYKLTKNFQAKTSRNSQQNDLKILARHHSKDSTKMKSIQKNLYADCNAKRIQRTDKSKFKIKLMKGSLLDRCKIQNSDQKEWGQRKLSFGQKKSYSTVRKILIKQHQRIFMMSTGKQKKEEEKGRQKSYENQYKKAYTQAMNTNQAEKSNKSDEDSEQKHSERKLKGKIPTENKVSHKSKPKCLITKTKKLPFEIPRKPSLLDAVEKQIREEKQCSLSQNNQPENIVEIERKQGKISKCQFQQEDSKHIEKPSNLDPNQQLWNLQLSQIFHQSDSEAFITIESYKKFECK